MVSVRPKTGYTPQNPSESILIFRIEMAMKWPYYMGPMPVPDMTSFQQAERRQPAVGEISFIDCIVFPPTGTGAGTKTQSNI